MRLLICCLPAIVFMGSCKLTESKICGTYRLSELSQTKLVLHRDKSFEFVKNFAEPGPAFLPDSAERNFRTSGTWQVNADRKLILNSAAIAGTTPGIPFDSVTRNTGITTLSFWDKNGEPLAIRYIRFLPDKMKFYRGNTISFFKEDFAIKDTLEFNFYGYGPVRWPSTTAPNYYENHTHRFTLYEETRSGFFEQYPLSLSRKKLVSSDGSFVLRKRK